MQMKQLEFWQIVLIAFLLVSAGFLVPFLTVIQVLPASFILLFLSYAASVGGLLLVIVGATQYVYKKRKEREWKQEQQQEWEEPPEDQDQA